MGTSYTFSCDECGYEVESSGELDSGMQAVVEPHICNDCKEITDVLVGEFGMKIKKADLPKFKLSEKDFYRCNNCKSSNIIEWDRKNACPKCGNGMKKGDIAVLWD